MNMFTVDIDSLSENYINITQPLITMDEKQLDTLAFKTTTTNIKTHLEHLPALCDV